MSLRKGAIIACCAFSMLLLDANATAQESTHRPATKPSLPVDGKVKARVLIDHARVDLEAGRLENAEKKLRGALEMDSENRAANYYLTLIRERRQIPQRAVLEAKFPVIKRYDGTLQYGVPAHERPIRESAHDLKAK
jgi:hypothetical protein